MMVRAMPASITARMASTPEVLACFDDDALVRGALAFERALGAALAEHGVIAVAAAAAIAQACDGFDASGLAELAAHAGTLAIPLVARLRAAVPAGHAAAVHHGATSQDVADTALALQIAEALPLIDRELDAIGDALAAIARAHAATPALGRTLLQPAEPITFGMRAANWLLAIDAAHGRIDRERAAARRLQFGGAVGSLAALGAAGPAVRASLAARLGLVCAPAWHSRRDALAGLGAALGIAIGALGKLARDVALLMQRELAEVAEPAIAGRGGSSAMPGKRNPTGCQVALSAAIRAPGLVASLLAGLPQELERGLGGWQAEAPVLGELFALAGGAGHAMRVVVEGLTIDGGAIAAAITAHAGAAPPAAVAAAVRFVDDALAVHAATIAARSAR
ncbi:MAG TPA: lyase family protein [Kofleriaceae bacterium]|jgi:3-carboxy-cis,cis-muconate cycloisomerase|nr:lyase family protein [Kofleriaceae bacterium]